ncbi:Predicted amidophosphoribosyltransferases [Marvinbryantia formatexigens]|nr:Predicted amidophosphoribosyltransferases [Marvinbryantia formatexigens]
MAALDLVLPRRCPLCGKLSEGICEKCREELPYIRGAVCFRCGRPLADDTEEYCPSCSSGRLAYTQGRALYLYRSPLKESLYAVKYQNKREYLEYYAQEIAEHLGEYLQKWRPQVLIPVPMHSSARRRRGYNQAELLARELGGLLSLPVRCDVLEKVRKTANQKELDYRARRSNLKGAFAVSEKYAAAGAGSKLAEMEDARARSGLVEMEDAGAGSKLAEMEDARARSSLPETAGSGERRLPWERILLVDDVYTTGSTIHEAASVLRSAGVKYVYFVTICMAG